MKSLEKVMKLELLEDKSADQIADIWTKHFAELVLYPILLVLP